MMLHVTTMVGAAARANKATSPSAPAEGEKEITAVDPQQGMLCDNACQGTQGDTCEGKMSGSAPTPPFSVAQQIPTHRLVSFRICLRELMYPFSIPFSQSYGIILPSNVVHVQH